MSRNGQARPVAKGELTILPTAALSAAFAALQRRISRLQAVTTAQGPSNGVCTRIDSYGNRSSRPFSLGLVFLLLGSFVQRDGEWRTGASRDRTDAQGLEGGDGPGFNVDDAGRCRMVDLA